MKTIAKAITLLLLLSGNASGLKEFKNVVRIDLEHMVNTDESLDSQIDLQTLEETQMLQGGGQSAASLRDNYSVLRNIQN